MSLMTSWRPSKRTEIFLLGAPWLFLFMQPIPHSAAIRSLNLVWLIIAAGICVVRYRAANIDGSPLLRSIFLLLGVLCLSAILGVSPLESFNALRKELLAPLLSLFILLSVAEIRKVWVVILTATIGGFALRTFLVLPEWPMIAFPQRLEAQWVKGYVMDAMLYMPIAISTAIIGLLRTWKQVFLVSLIVLEVAIVIAYGSRTGLVALLMSAVVGLLFARRYKMLFFYGACVVAAFFVTVIAKPELKQHYGVIFQPQSYIGAGGMSGRNPIWQGVAELVDAKPWLGYGPGWKKMADVARDGGYIDRWRGGSEREKLTATYFDNDGGTVNPHNLALQILFEAGLLGLLSFAFVWVAFLKIIICAWRRSQDDILRWLSVTGISFFVAYFIINISNGLWPMSGPVVGLLALAELSRRYMKVSEGG